jgi:hypothetical protein
MCQTLYARCLKFGWTYLHQIAENDVDEWVATTPKTDSNSPTFSVTSSCLVSLTLMKTGIRCQTDLEDAGVLLLQFPFHFVLLHQIQLYEM